LETTFSGEPITNPQGSRYLIDFITGISDPSFGLAPLYRDPGVDIRAYFGAHECAADPEWLRPTEAEERGDAHVFSRWQTLLHLQREREP